MFGTNRTFVRNTCLIRGKCLFSFWWPKKKKNIRICFCIDPISFVDKFFDNSCGNVLLLKEKGREL